MGMGELGSESAQQRFCLLILFHTSKTPKFNNPFKTPIRDSPSSSSMDHRDRVLLDKFVLHSLQKASHAYMKINHLAMMN
jgi:hypothetical protein